MWTTISIGRRRDQSIDGGINRRMAGSIGIDAVGKSIGVDAVDGINLALIWTVGSILICVQEQFGVNVDGGIDFDLCSGTDWYWNWDCGGGIDFDLFSEGCVHWDCGVEVDCSLMVERWFEMIVAVGLFLLVLMCLQ